ncbi:glycosyltransferase family 4 protein [Dongia deserti]|uniref:glycosyltransferase family 4 protein n=1 Tax=Dongia deserti TaxID=2268030 RepID=UPI000E64F405|nr:glycosyltransferase family 4 protein [Dongia deserti]
MPPANAAIHYVPAGYDTTGPKLMGRMAAGEGFLDAFLRHAGVERFYCYASERKAAEQFAGLARSVGATPVEWIPWANPTGLAKPGALYIPDPSLHDHAWRRRGRDQRAYSLTGITHTTASSGAMDMIAEFAVAPVQEWDALICTAKTVRTMVEALMDEQAAYLKGRLGAQRVPRPQLPIIPLGVDCARFAMDPAIRATQRDALGIGPDDVVFLFVGRLSFHAKAHPYPMYLALERAAQRTAKRLHLVQAGWFANDFIETAFRDGARDFCPSVTAHFLDARKPEVRFAIWQAADIFTSLSDNIQETFGLTPIEAMAAGLPSVVTDWDGYRDTVQHGEHGIRVPTLAPPPGLGVDLADAHAIGIDTYDRYCGYASQFIAVDIDATAEAYVTLINNPDLCAKLGAAARKTAQGTFDWRHVIARYQELWAELAARRAAATEFAPALGAIHWPARADPFTLFADYPSETLSLQHRLERGDFPGNLTTIVDHHLFSFAKHRLRLDLCEHVLRKVMEQSGTDLAAIGAGLNDADRALLLRNAAFLAKIGLIRVRPRGSAS